MKKTFSSKKSAFSLIELSIVLIIIGLLIAGITGGASLIKSSELRSVMGEARGYAVAVNAFYTQYNALPGDYSTQGLGTSRIGDGNSQINYHTATAEGGAAGTLSPSESANAWNMLKTIGAIDTITSTTFVEASTPPTFGTNAPASKIKASGWAFSYIAANTQNVVVLTGTISAATDTVAAELNTLASAAITPADALSIDSKIDDGVANTGKIRGLVTGCNTTPAVYTTTTTTKACALSYQVDVNS